MIEGRLFPHPPTLLAATLGVTFVGAKNKPLSVFPDLVYVSRVRVHAALVWLQKNNPLYADIVISDERQREIFWTTPEPLFKSTRATSLGTTATTKMRTKKGSRARTNMDARGQPPAEGEGEEAEYEPDVFPIQASGVLDTVGDEVTDNDLLRHAAENVLPRNVAREYGIRKGNAFVNEYARKDERGQRNIGRCGRLQPPAGGVPISVPFRPDILRRGYVGSSTGVSEFGEHRIEAGVGQRSVENRLPGVAMENGRLVLKDQMKEYADRGVELASMNIYDYYTLTYHGEQLAGAPSAGDDGRGIQRRGPSQNHAGRRASKRVPYLPESNRKGCRIIRRETWRR
ncbi:ATP-dependent DNA helicase [Mycena chlorophos]|uniref:ATP-dependent DNA helicase n=1 Tax=Mycena chlorophos TaxID=658473 RepID=A0A8H6WLS4_MYCCL|nr:ATP-dependent DNA helicase [Mycena chlorophos]